MKKICRHILPIILLLVSILFSSCSLYPEDNNNTIINIPDGPSSSSTIAPQGTVFNAVKPGLMDFEALFNVVNSSIAGEKNSNSFYCSYILNRFYISSICSEDNAMASFCTDVYNAIATFQTEYEIPRGMDIDTEAMQTAMFALLEDCPELFHFAPSYTYYTRAEKVVSLEFEYTMSPEEYRDALKAVYDRFDTWLIDFTGTHDYELELYIYDRILEACSYSDSADYCRTPYGAVVLGQALCEGYSQAFTMAMQYCDIYCFQVGGMAQDLDTNESESHAWNIIKIQDEYYQVDPTWDDYDDETSSSSLYAFFNITDEQMYSNRTIEGQYLEFDIPVCNATEYSYYSFWGNTIEDDTDMKLFLYEQLDNHAANLTEPKGTLLLSIRFTNNDMLTDFLDNILKWLEEWNIGNSACRITGYSVRVIDSMGVAQLEIYSELHNIDPQYTDSGLLMPEDPTPDITEAPPTPPPTPLLEPTQPPSKPDNVIPVP